MNLGKNTSLIERHEITNKLRSWLTTYEGEESDEDESQENEDFYNSFSGLIDKLENDFLKLSQTEIDFLNFHLDQIDEN